MAITTTTVSVSTQVGFPKVILWGIKRVDNEIWLLETLSLKGKEE
jgi:hypothetical protein